MSVDRHDKPARERPGLIRVVPNLLTSARLVLGLTFPFLPIGARGAVLLAAAATEFLDGYVARLLGVMSATGRILDPIADKVFVISVLVTLLADGTLAPWQLVLVASRDIIVAAGAFRILIRLGVSALRRMPPSFLGKCATAAQFLFLLVTVLNREANDTLFFVTSALSLAAGVDYAMRFR